MGEVFGASLNVDRARAGLSLKATTGKVISRIGRQGATYGGKAGGGVDVVGDVSYEVDIVDFARAVAIAGSKAEDGLSHTDVGTVASEVAI